MTEEENKAIESLKTKIEFMGDNYYKIMSSQVFNDLRKETKVALNLIEKLKKENEELKNKVAKREKEIIELEEYANKNFERKDDVKAKYISKDKIREKIEEYNKEIKTYEDKMLEITQIEKHNAIENEDYIKYSCIISNLTDKIKLLEEILGEE